MILHNCRLHSDELHPKLPRFYLRGSLAPHRSSYASSLHRHGLWIHDLMRLELSTGVLNHDLQVPRPECSEKMQNFPTRKQNYAENIYTEGNHAARQIHHAARGCNSINYAARGNRITRRVIKSEALFFFNQDFTPRVVQSYAARGQSENPGSLWAPSRGAWRATPPA